MKPERFVELTACYARLRVAIVGDFCLDRYLEIDPTRNETSIETGRTVHNVMRVRAQPGASGTILNNLVALGVGTIHVVGFRGDDGEGYELERALAALPGVSLDDFLTTPLRRTFTYCKPLVVEPDKTPVELNRLDSKNWTPTPESVERTLIASVQDLANEVDALIVMDQVDVPNTGVVTARVLQAVGEIARKRDDLRIVGDSRRGLQGWPRVTLKMNAAELAVLSGGHMEGNSAAIDRAAMALAAAHGRDVIVTLAERGVLGASPEGRVVHAPALPLRGSIDVVGAGDSVTANLTAALAAGADLREALELAMAAASEVIHQLGTTGTASLAQIAKLLANPA